jgi:hypothetical protein
MSKAFKSVSSSRYVTSTVSGERVRAFVPAPLPPDARTFNLASLQNILAEANQAVGRLVQHPRTCLFSSEETQGCFCIRRNAVLSYAWSA